MFTETKQSFVLRTARRSTAEAQIDLSQSRQWFANEVAYGFIGQEHLFAERIINVPVETVQTAVMLSLEMHNREINALMDGLVERTSEYQINYQLAAAGELQPLDEDGNPRPTQPKGTYTVAFPIRGGGDAYGTNRVSRAKATVADMNRWTWNMLTRDARWIRRFILSAIFTNAAYTYVDKEHGSITVQPLALTSDGVTYVRNTGTAATDEHFYAQAAAISNSADPFPTWYTELNEHPNNMGPYVAYVPTNQVSAVKTLADFHPADDANLIMGADVTRAAIAANVDSPVSDSPFNRFGNKYLGYHDAGVHVVQWDSLPDNYGFVEARGADPVLGMREYPEAELQGFFPEFFDMDGNHMGVRFIRFAGFGVMNRVGALAYRIGNSTYSAPPTGYDARAI